MVSISSAEAAYIRQGITEGSRNDGRSALQFRHIDIQCDTVQQSNGSASCSIGGTQVIVAVRADIGVPYPESPEQGDINCTVDISPCALQGLHTDAMCTSLAKSLHRSLRWQTQGPGSAIDLHQLSIISGKRCWVLSVEGLVISVDGSVLGALSMATKAALTSLRIPHIQVEMAEDGEEPEIDLDDDMENATSLDTSRVPLIVTVHTVEGTDLVDLTAEEESACSEAALHVAVNPKGTVGLVDTIGSKPTAPEELLGKVRVAQTVGSQLHKILNSKLSQQ